MTNEIIEAEFSLIATAIMDPTVMDRVENIVSFSDFTKTHQRAWTSLCDFKAAGGPLGDSRQVLAMFSRVGVIADLGGFARLADIQTALPHNAEYYARVVREGSQARKLDRIAGDIRMMLEKGDPAGDVASWASAQMEGVVGSESGLLQSIGTAANEAYNKILDAKERGVSIGFGTGLADFDASYGGMFPSDLIVLAARPSIGKTALGMQMAMHVAKNYGPVLMVSLEMKGSELCLRMMARDAGISTSELRSASVSDSDLETLRKSVEEISAHDMTLLAQRNVTPPKIRAAARLKRATGGLSMVVVDYIGLIGSDDPKKNTIETAKDASKALKDLAMELDVPVLALCQLNRVAEKEVPGIHHLRDSGAIEQDADVVWLLHRETRSSDTATLNVAKVRQGATGEYKMRFDPPTTTFSPMTAKQMGNYEPAFTEFEGGGYGGSDW